MPACFACRTSLAGQKVCALITARDLVLSSAASAARKGSAEPARKSARARLARRRAGAAEERLDALDDSALDLCGCELSRAWPRARRRLPTCSRSISRRALKIRMARGCASSSKAPMSRPCSRADPATPMNALILLFDGADEDQLARRPRAMEAVEGAGPCARLLAAGRTRRLGEESVSLDPMSPEFQAPPRRGAQGARRDRSGDARRDGGQFEATGMVRGGLCKAPKMIRPACPGPISPRIR